MSARSAPIGRREGIDFHGLRHAATSLMVATGEHPRVTQARLGHATPHLTLGLYAHVPHDADRAAVVRTMRSNGLAAKSIRTYVGTLAAIFNSAVELDLLFRSPVRGLGLERSANNQCTATHGAHAIETARTARVIVR